MHPLLMRHSAQNSLAAGVMIGAAWMMLPAFSAGPLVLDEHAAYWLSAPAGELSVTERSLRYAAAPPLACWAQSASMQLLGETETALRLPSILGYLVAVGLLAFGTRPSIGGIAAVMSAAALALHPDVVDEVRVGRMYGLVVLWTALLLVVTLRWQQKKIGWRLAVVWGVAAAAAVWTHILTIPVVGMSAVMLVVGDLREVRTLRRETLAGWLLSVVLCLPLIPMVERIWEWRNALNYQTGAVSFTSATGPFLWLAVPQCAMLALVLARIVGTRPTNDAETGDHFEAKATPRGISLSVAVALGLVPLLVLAVIGRDDLTSLANPRYRVPLAAANACLLGLLAARLKSTTFGVACLSVSLLAAWIAVGRWPTDLVRLGVPQSITWKEIGKTLQQTVQADGLETAPLFVQSGLIEGMLIPVFPEDLQFHGYVSSRLGRFYADTPNPRYALPLPGGGDALKVRQFFVRTLTETAARDPSDLFVAVATDTDINRSSYEQFAKSLSRFGYVGTPLTGHEQSAMLYHFRKASPR